jgi:TonB family protein
MAEANHKSKNGCSERSHRWACASEPNGAWQEWARGLNFLSSAANTVAPGNSGQGKDGSGTPRPNPVALEALINVTGANVTSGDGARRLFSEDTTTVLVFKDGAVIRLDAPVAVGQLIFVTNKKSNQEVVCQVLRQRNFKAARNYVELQFTEERNDYWGVTFPEGQKSAPQFKATEQVQAEETTAEGSETPIAPHNAEDVDKLKREVEALREQLAALEKKNVKEAATKLIADTDAAREAGARELAMQNAATDVEAVTAQAVKHKEELAVVNDRSPGSAQAEDAKQAQEKQQLLMPAAPKETNQATRPVVSMSLPVWKMEKSPEEQLLEEEAQAEVARAAQPQIKPPEKPFEEVPEELPKPELDFSQLGKESTKKQKKGKNSTVAPNKVRAAGLSAVLALAVAGGAWYGKWWQYLPLAKKKSPPAAVAHPAPPRTLPAVAKTNSPASGPSSTANTPGGNETAKPAAADIATNAEAPAVKPVEIEPVVPAKRSKREKASERQEIEKSQETPGANEMAANDGPSQPARLLKPANPVYPPDAMRSYITGDVKAEVTVLPSGHVGEVKIISGPNALREAAVEALKRYEYSPAAQGGKPVESRTTEVVKFWFNP